MQNENGDPIETIPGTKLAYVLSSLPQPTGPLCPTPKEPEKVLAGREMNDRKHRTNWRGEKAKRIIDLETGNTYDDARDAADKTGMGVDYIRRQAAPGFRGSRRFEYFTAA